MVRQAVDMRGENVGKSAQENGRQQRRPGSQQALREIRLLFTR